MQGTFPRWVLGLTICSAFGCKSLETGAKEHFAKKYSCPEDRVEAHARPDLRWSKIVFGDRPEEVPPDEVKNDPGRLAKWNEDHQGNAASLDKFDVFEAKGCGHEQIMACLHPKDDQGTSTDRVVCIDAPERPKAPKK